MFSSNLEPLKIQKFSDPLAPTMVGPAGDTELSKSLHIFFANHFLILNLNPVSERVYHFDRKKMQTLVILVLLNYSYYLYLPDLGSSFQPKVKKIVGSKILKHPQTARKPSKLPTNQPNHPQITPKPAKPPTNHPSTEKTTQNQSKTTSFFPS